MNPLAHVVVGCGSLGLPVVSELVNTAAGAGSVIALEASARIGGSTFLAARLTPPSLYSAEIYEQDRTIPPLKIWWERNWVSADEVDWSDKNWAFVLPQWKIFFGPLVEISLRKHVVESIKEYVATEKPVSEIKFADGVWTLQSGDKTYATSTVHWTLGLKAFQGCFGKKEAEEFMQKNPTFDEAAREADGMFVAEYLIPDELVLASETSEHFVGIPVRHDGKFYLSFVSIRGRKVETFTYLPNEQLKQPKEISFFEKSLKRSIKHVLANEVPELTSPNLGIINEARGFYLTSPWTLTSMPDRGIYFYDEPRPKIEPAGPSVEATL